MVPQLKKKFAFISGNLRIRCILHHVGISPSTYYRIRKRQTFNSHYSSTRKRKKKPISRKLSRAIIKVALSHPMLGYKKIHAILKRSGFKVSRRKVYQVLKEANLLKSKDWRKETCAKMKAKLAHLKPQKPNDLWQIDITYFKPPSDATCYIINVIDYFSGFVLVSLPVYSYTASDGKLALKKAFDYAKSLLGDDFCCPVTIVTDNGPTFIAKSFKNFLANHHPQGTKHLRSAYHRPEHIGKVERFHQNLKYEFLFPHEPRNILELKILADYYRWYHNFQRPHWSLGLKTPAEVYLEKDKDKVRKIALELQKSLGKIEILQEAA